MDTETNINYLHFFCRFFVRYSSNNWGNFEFAEPMNAKLFLVVVCNCRRWQKQLIKILLFIANVHKYTFLWKQQFRYINSCESKIAEIKVLMRRVLHWCERFIVWFGLWPDHSKVYESVIRSFLVNVQHKQIGVAFVYFSAVSFTQGRRLNALGFFSQESQPKELNILSLVNNNNNVLMRY